MIHLVDRLLSCKHENESRKEFIKRIGITSRRILQWSTLEGIKRTPVIIFLQVANALSVQPVWLIFGEGEQDV